MEMTFWLPQVESALRDESVNRHSTRRALMKPFQLPRWKFSTAAVTSADMTMRMRAARALARRGVTSSRVLRQALAALSAVAALPVDAVAQGRTYPPPPPSTSPVDGLIDFHVHTAPDVFGRALADDEEAPLSKDRGMEAVVLKSHTALTADRAWIARRRAARHEDLRRHHPQRLCRRDQRRMLSAWMWRMQGGYGRVVWFPTFDANNHVHTAQGSTLRHQGRRRRRQSATDRARGPEGMRRAETRRRDWALVRRGSPGDHRGGA